MTQTLTAKAMVIPRQDRLAAARAALAEFEKAKWTGAYINDLPDSAFAFVEGGGEKDKDGKTTPRSLRHFPHHDADGKLDLPHLRNALSRAPQSPFGSKALAHLKRHARAAGVGEDDDKALPHDHEHDAAHYELKDQLPMLIGDEARHVQALTDALNAINALIAQELQEEESEYECIMELCCIAQSLVNWAWGEASEYGMGSSLSTPMELPPGDTSYGATSAEGAQEEKTAEEPSSNTEVEAAAPVEPPQEEASTSEAVIEEGSVPLDQQRGLPPWMLAALAMAWSEPEPVPAHNEPTLSDNLQEFIANRRIAHRGQWPL